MNEMIESAANKVKSAVSGLGVPDYASSVAEDYTKRVLEAKYDKLAKTALFKKLKNMEDRERFLIEFVFYSLNAFLKNGLSENSPLKKYFKGIAADFFPEMGKRLINGDATDGKEVIGIAIDEKTNSGFAVPAKPENPKQPGFFAGVMSVIDERAKNSLQKNKGGDRNV